MNFQWSPRSFTIPDGSFSGLRGLHDLQNFLKRFKTVFQRSFRKIVFRWSFSSLSAVSRWTFTGLISLSTIFQQSLISEGSQQSRSVFQRACRGLGQSIRVLSVVLVCLSEIFSNTPDNLSVISQWSSWSLNKLSAVFRVPWKSRWNCCFWSFNCLSGPFHRDSKFYWSWRLLKDLANFWSFSGLSTVSVLWNGGLKYCKYAM